MVGTCAGEAASETAADADWGASVGGAGSATNIFQERFDLISKTIQTEYQLKFFFIPQYRLTF